MEDFVPALRHFSKFAISTVPSVPNTSHFHQEHSLVSSAVFPPAARWLSMAFNPEKSIPDLTSKVILVTEG